MRGAVRVCGHFGEFLQGRLGPEGPVALVTLPCPVLQARAVRSPGALVLHVPGLRLFRGAQVRVFIDALGLPRSGRFTLRLDMPPGGGAGASTAALIAVAHAAGVTDRARIAAACIAAEGASDPLMAARPAQLLWASRQGRALAHLPVPARVEVLGGFFGPMLRTDPGDDRFPDIADLARDWPSACHDPARLAQLATLSAARTLAMRGGGADDPTAALAARHGALGWAIAHTGAARALIFRPGTVPGAARSDLREAGFRRIIGFRTGGGA